MMWCEKILINEDGIKYNIDCQVIDTVFLVHKIFTLEILQNAQNTEGNIKNLDLCFFKTIDC